MFTGGNLSFKVKASKVDYTRKALLSSNKTAAAKSYQRKKKEEEAKSLRAQQEAAAVYAEFVESFKAPEASAGISASFVKGGSMGGNVKATGKGAPQGLGMGMGLGFQSSSSPAVPKNAGAPMFVKAGASKPAGFPVFVKAGPSLPKPPPPAANSPAGQLQTPAVRRKRKEKKVKKKSEMELFMEEMKREKETAAATPAVPRLAVGPGAGAAAMQGGLGGVMGLGGLARSPLLAHPVGVALGMRPALLPSFGQMPVQGHHYDGNTGTTNLYCGNLAPTMTEERLVRIFGRYGDVASVKIMWPRTEDEKRRKRNSGFVSFMRRDDAVDALDNLTGVTFMDYAMKLGWGKAVTLPTKPLYLQNPNPPPEEMSDPLPPVVDKVQEEVIPPKEDIALPSTVVRYTIRRPLTARLLQTVNLTADYVAKLGHVFEKQVMIKESGNPEFNFMFETTSPDHFYYRWKVYSLSQGDDMKQWRESPFQMMIGGPFWVPPPIKPPDKEEAALSNRKRARTAGIDSRKRDGAPRSAVSPQRERDKTRLSKSNAKQFMSILRNLTRERTSIEEAMAFCLSHAEKSKDVVEIIADSLCVFETPLARKLARLYLVSDVLYNSSSPVRNASSFRTLLRDNLKTIFKGLGDKFASIEGRLTASSFRDKVSMVLNVWTAWSLFPAAFIENLEVTFLGDTIEREKRENELARRQELQQKPSNTAIKMQAGALGGLGGYGSGKSDGDSSDEDVDGVPFGEQVGKQGPTSLAGLVGEPEEDIDGEDIDGEEIDGVPMQM